MGISDAERLRELFDEVISRPPAEREAFIDVACAADDELRGRLRSLVSNSIEDTLFESPSDADTIIESMRRAIRRTVEPPFRERQRVGPYVIHEILGTGGTSVVYRATQESPVRREVAVKVIKPGMDSEAVLARFDRERYVLAMMEHPNIAKIFDAGATPNGRPYFVMELIRGEPVTAYADRLKLDDDRRIALFLDICRAMQHAHMRGVLHRDVKPSNIMVEEHEGVPTPKIIDFGISKATQEGDRYEHTLAGHIVGTPIYMSPEQWLSEKGIDVRTDVYALGILLYRLLSGTFPYPVEPGQEMNRYTVQTMIAREHPSPLSQTAPSGGRHRKRGGDLDWILLKAIAKDAEDRYHSVEAFADDLRRFGENLPIDARPPGLLYRVGLYCRRRRAVALGALVASVALIIGVSALAYHTHRVEGELVAKTEALERAESAEREAQRNLDRHSALISGLLTQEMFALRPDIVLHDLEQGVRASVQPDAWAQVEHVLNGIDRNAIMRQILWDQVYEGRIEAIDRTYPDDTADRAGMLMFLGQTLLVRGYPEHAISPIKEAIAIREPSDSYPRHAEHLVYLADAYRRAGQHGEAERILRDVIDRWDEFRVSELHPPVFASVRLAETLIDTGRMEEAEDALQAFLDHRLARLVGDQNLYIAGDIAFAKVLHMKGDHAGAERLLRATLEYCDRRFTDPHSLTETSLVWLGDVLLTLGRPSEAEPLARRARDMIHRSRGKFDPRYAIAESVHGRAIADEGRYDDAEPVLLNAYERLTSREGGYWTRRELRELVSRIADLLEATGRERDAAHWRQITASL